MNPDKSLDALARICGIAPGYRDLAGEDRPACKETKIALLRAIGLQLDSESMIGEELKRLRAADTERIMPRQLVVASGEEICLDIKEGTEWHLRLDGEHEIAAEGRSVGSVRLAPTVSGVHDLVVRYGKHSENIRLICAPRSAPCVKDLTGRHRLWGVNAALYGLHSDRSVGLGDFADLANAAQALAGHGADFFGINPVHDIGWNDTETISPYSPSHRGFLNTAHIATDRIPGLEGSGAVAGVLRKLRNMSGRGDVLQTIDYAQHRLQHHQFLQQLFDLFTAEASPEMHQAFHRFCHNQGAALARFALFETIGEQYGPDWRKWPNDLRRRAEVGSAHRFPAERQTFHSWLQWVSDHQLANAHRSAMQNGMALGLYLDLAVGARRGGAETWCDGDITAQGVSIGAPPDHLSPAGQNWNLAAISPPKLADGNYRAFRDILARTMKHCGILRIDHILGLNRSYWVPDDGSPGGYICQPSDALLAIVAIEAERAGTVVIGEDLGLVPDGFREAMNERNIYGYSVLQFEKEKTGDFRHPNRLNEESLACFGTHDTPTLKGFWCGRDIDWWHKIGWIGEEEAAIARAERSREVTTLHSFAQSCAEENHPAFSDFRTAIHGALAQSPVSMVSVQLDDAFGEIEAQNLPGTIDEHANWRRRHGVPVEEFTGNPDLREIGNLMFAAGRSGRQHERRESAL